MSRLILGIHYPPATQQEVRQEWAARGLDFHFTDTLQDGVDRLKELDYVCVVIYLERVPHH